jgi:hypothetical protein
VKCGPATAAKLIAGIWFSSIVGIIAIKCEEPDVPTTAKTLSTSTSFLIACTERCGT